MKVVITPRARRRIDVVDRWWREHRQAAPSLFSDELDALIARLLRVPEIGTPYPTVSEPQLRRALLSQTQQYVYYAVDRVAEVILITTVWGAARGRGPKL